MLLTLLLLACPGGADSNGGSGGDSPAVVDCWSLSPDACAAEATCTVLTGRELQIPDTGGATCYTLASPEPVGCMPNDVGCGGAITFGTGGDGCYRFTSTCQPTGWSSCDVDYNDWSEC